MRIVDKHNGSIGVDSEPGKGTTFIIRLPMSASAENAEMDETEEIVKKAGMM